MTHAAIRLLPGSLYDRMMIALGPVAWWELADAVGSSTAKDSSGNGHDGTVNGGVTFGKTGPITGTPGDTGALFDGSTGYIELSSDVVNQLAKFTALFWMKSSSTGYEPIICTRTSSGTAGSGWEVSYSYPVSGQFEMAASNGAGVDVLNSNSEYAASTWHMVAATYDGNGTASFNVDGSAAGSNTSYAITKNTEPFLIGARYSDTPGSNLYTGTLAQVAIFDYALTSTQIADLYAAASV